MVLGIRLRKIKNAKIFKIYQLLVMSDRDYDYFFRILIVGDRAVGKTCMLSRFMADIWNEKYTRTIGLDLHIKLITVKGKVIKLQLWDTTELNVDTNYNYLHAQGILLMYDCTNRESFDKIWVWMEKNGKYLCEEVRILLVGNKCDLKEEKVITSKMAKALAGKYNIPFIETSAKTPHNIEKCFRRMVKFIRKQAVLPYVFQEDTTRRCKCELI